MKLKDLLSEDIKDRARAAKKTQSLQKAEGQLRKTMMKLVEIYNKDEVNKPLAKQLKSSYRIGVTKFMKDSIAILKKVK